MTDHDRTSGRRPGPVYDDAMKILADDDLDALLSILGIHGHAEPVNVELAASTRTADLLARTEAGGIVHVEFVKDPTPDLDLRMVDYRLRIRRRDRVSPIHQHVLALRDIDVPAEYADVDRDRLRCTWTVVRLGELDPATLLQTPTTAAVAALARGTTEQRLRTLTAAAELIAARTDPDRGRILLRAAATLASIVLTRRTITTALEEATMPVPIIDTPLGREWYEEGREKGRQEGRQAVLHLMLRQRFGSDDPRLDSIAARLAALIDDARIARLTAADSLDELDAQLPG